MKRLIKKAIIPTLEDFYDFLDYEFEEIGLQTVKVDDIVGMSYPRNEEYNDDFSPKVKDERWEYQYNLVINGGTMEPIHLNLMPNGKYTVSSDGNHRLSVAKTCGIQYIDAYVYKMVEKNKSNNSQNELMDLKNQYNIIRNKIINSYELTDEEVKQLETQMFEIADKIELLN